MWLKKIFLFHVLSSLTKNTIPPNAKLIFDVELIKLEWIPLTLSIYCYMPTGISFIKKRQFYWQMIKGKNYNFVKFPISVHILVFLKDFVYLHCLDSEWMFFFMFLLIIDIWSAMTSFTILSFFLCFEEKRSWECQYQDVNAVFRMLFGQFIFSMWMV